MVQPVQLTLAGPTGATIGACPFSARGRLDGRALVARLGEISAYPDAHGDDDQDKAGSSAPIGST